MYVINRHMKCIIVLLLLTSFSYGSFSISEKTQDRLYPFRNNGAKFDLEFSRIVKEYPNDVKIILQTVVLSFDLTKEHIATLIDIACKKKIDAKGVVEPAKKEEKLDPLKTLIRPLKFKPVQTPPSATGV